MRWEYRQTVRQADSETEIQADSETVRREYRQTGRQTVQLV